MILVDNVCFQYPNGKDVLKGLKFNIKKGEFVAIIGQNGAGKTTLLKHLNALLRPSNGRVMICGYDASNMKTSELSRHIGFLFQNPDHQIFCSTVYDEIAFGLKSRNVDKKEIDGIVKSASGQVGLLPYLNDSPFSLSKAQRQRVALASVLVLETDILVLDEPTTGQDYKESAEIMEIVTQLNKQGKTIIIVTHDMELVAKYAKRVIVLMSGKVIDDGPTEVVLSNTANLLQSNLQAPQIYRLAKKFDKQGFFKDSFSVEDMFQEIMSYLEGEENVSNG